MSMVLGSRVEVGSWLGTLTITQGGSYSGLNEPSSNRGGGKRSGLGCGVNVEPMRLQL